MNKFIVINKENIKIGYYFEEDKLSEIRCYENDSLLGNIYIGKVSNILSNINAAFVDIASGKSCYLPLEDYKKDRKLKIGDLIVVQIVKDSIKTKQPTVTTDICLTGKYAVVHTDKTVGISAKIKDSATRESLKHLFVESLDEFEPIKKCRDLCYGAILRTSAAAYENDNNISKNVKTEILMLLEKLDDMLYKAQFLAAYSKVYKSEESYIKDMHIFSEKPECDVITDDKGIYEEYVANYNDSDIKLYSDNMISLSNLYNLNSLTEKAFNKRVYLKSGAYLVIEPTEAMTVIDVNSGKAIKGKNSEEYIYKLNIEAAREIARQLRIRNLSGIIIVDFVSMKNDKLNNSLLNELKSLILKDDVPVKVVDITSLGLVELTRKKVRKPLYEMAHLIKN